MPKNSKPLAVVALLVALAGWVVLARYPGNRASASDAPRMPAGQTAESTEAGRAGSAGPEGATGSLIDTTATGSNIVPAAPPASKSPTPSAAPAAASTPAATPALQSGLVLQDGGIPRSFELALDEVWVRDADGKGKPLPVRAGDSDDLERQLASLPGNPEAILYLQGEPRGEISRRVVTNRVTVRLIPGADPAAVAAAVGAASFETPAYAPGHVVLQTAPGLASLRAAAALRGRPDVESAEAQLARQQSRRTMPNDTLINSQWHLKFNNQSGAVTGTDIQAESVWAYPTAGAGWRGRNVRIGIVDDGLQTNHPDLQAHVDTVNDKDWNGNDFDPNPGSGDDHGTACAGNAGAVGNNGVGVSGSAPESTLVGMRLIAAVTTDSQEADAMGYLPQLIQIKSNSWGPSDTGTVLEGPGSLTLAAFKSAAETGRGGKGTIFFWAGGNGLQYKDDANYDGYANSIYTIAVAAFDSQSRQAYYSEPGACLVVTSPSSGSSPALKITTTDRTGSVGYSTGNYATDFGGTSSATPTAAGVAALMLEANPNLGWRDVQEILMASARKVNPSDADWITNAAGFHFNHKFGAGLVNATAAVNLATTWSPLGPQINRTLSQTGLALTIFNQNTIGVTRQFVVSPANNLRVEHVTVKVNINHTARGNLKITLTSPSGTVSRLAEVHSDSGDNYPDWTFMTVRNWGENGVGTWQLKITDESGTGNTLGGTLTAATMTLFGTALIPANPPPSVTLTSPSTGAVFSPGTAVTLSATADDTTGNGTVGSIAQVEFLSNGTVVNTDTTAPYTFDWVPAVGSYAITARATDGEGAVSTTQPALIEVRNQRPVIHSVVIAPSGTAFSDEPLTASANDTSDPENDPITLAFQWESSTDGALFTDSAGDTAATLAPAAARLGRLWRCRITPSDAGGPGDAVTTPAVAINLRPPATAESGQPFSYDSDLFLRSTKTQFTHPVLINEFSQGSNDTSEWIELLVLRPASLRGWTIADGSGANLTFANSTLWDNLPAGTLVVIYNGASKDPLLPADDSTPGPDGSMIVSSSGKNVASGTWPSFANQGDALLLKNATGTLIDQLGYGSDTSTSPNIGSVGAAESANYQGNTEDGNDLPANWSIESALTTRSPRGGGAVLSGIDLSAGTYSQDFELTPGPVGTTYPAGWGCYKGRKADTSMSIGTQNSTSGANYNYGSRIGILGSSKSFNTASLVLAIASTSGRTNLRISYDIIKISEQGRSHDFSLAYSLTSPTSGFVAVPGGEYTSGNLAQGTVTTFANIPLPAELANRTTPVYLRWLYTPSSAPGLGSWDGLALDNVALTSTPPDPQLSVNVNPSAFSEAAGAAAANGTVTLTPAPASDVIVTLTSDNPNEATVPATVTITANTTSASFTVGAVDDAVIDGNQTVTLSAVAGALSANQTLTVIDSDAPPNGVTPGAGNGGNNTQFVADLRSGSLNQPALFRLGAASNTPDGLAIDPLTGVLAGTLAAPAGNYTVIIERTNALGELATQTFTLQVTDPPAPTATFAMDIPPAATAGFSQWIAGFAGAADATASGDPDHDGVANLAEYFLALSPETSDAAGTPVANVEGSELVMFYRRNNALSGITGTVVWSHDPANPAGWTAEGVSDTLVSDEGAYQWRRAAVPILPGESRKFLRLQITQP